MDEPLFYYIALPLFGAVKVLTQGRISQKYVEKTSDALMMNALVFSALVIVTGAISLRSLPSLRLLGAAAIMAVTSVGFQVLYTLAMHCGSVSLSAIVYSFNISISIAAGFLVYHEPFSSVKGIGFAFAAAAMCLIPARDGGKTGKKWLALIMGAFLFGGIMNLTTSFVSKGSLSGEKELFIVFGYAFAAADCFVLARILRKRDGGKLRPNGRLIGGASVIGIALGMFNILMVNALARIDSTVLYPIETGLSTALIAAADIILFRHKPTRLQYAGMVCGIIAIVLMNM